MGQDGAGKSLIGGGYVCMGDGSVRFITEFVDLLIWAEMSSMDEHEHIDWERL